MKVAINQVKGNSGIDVWAQSLCKGLQKAGVSCDVDLLPGFFQYFPGLIPIRTTPSGTSDIIQSHTWNGFGFRNETPLVVTEHGVLQDPLFDPYKSPLQKLYHRYLFRYEKKSLAVADAVVCVSYNTRERLKEVFGYSGAHVIYNGIDASVFRPREIAGDPWDLPQNKTILLFAGNLSRRKGADLLPGIMKNLGDDYLLLTTSGNRNRSSTGIPHSRNLGHLAPEQLIHAYNRCDLFILPSRLEGLSLSVLEAMACGKPVVAFNCSSFPELIIDEKGGFLPEKDNIEEFADRIRLLAGDPYLIRQMGLFNRERIVEQFTLERMVSGYMQLYTTLLD